MEPLEAFRKELEQELARRTLYILAPCPAGPYRNYDVHVAVAKDGHPHVDFYTGMRWDPGRLGPAVDYATQMLQNWEAQKVIHDKAKRDSERFFQILKAKFPDIELDYTVIDAETHYVRVQSIKRKLVAIFDLWPNMTDADIQRIANYITEYRKKVEGTETGMAGADYW